MSNVREQFEARFPVPLGVAWSDEHQNYGWVKKSAFQKTITYRALFTGWQASRESLVIELPAEKPMSHNHETEAARLAFNDAIEASREAIEAAGLKVAP